MRTPIDSIHTSVIRNGRNNMGWSPNFSTLNSSVEIFRNLWRLNFFNWCNFPLINLRKSNKSNMLAMDGVHCKLVTRQKLIYSLRPYDVLKLTSFSKVSLIAASKASYEVGTTAPASCSAWFFACADSNSPPLLAP